VGARYGDIGENRKEGIKIKSKSRNQQEREERRERRLKKKYEITNNEIQG